PADGEIIDFDLVNVQFQGSPNEEPTTIPYVPGGGGACGPEGGWYYDDPTHPTQIILCEATCSAVQGLTEGKVTVVFGCATVIR
ncbi:MAG: VWA domain-containing protein, partial [Deltaproteobacteria bacterium]|nr:VWA domain-containing protein [Deltaproteobacteria bacterium]